MIFRRCGTPGYISPEIIRYISSQTPRFSSKSDIYSAGIIFYILIIGVNPFAGKNFKEILSKNKTGTIGIEYFFFIII